MPALNFTGVSTATSFAWADLVLAGGVVLQKAPFLSIIFGLTGFQKPSSVLWTVDPNPFVSPVDNASVKLRVKRLRANGVDDLRDFSVSGQRELIISFRAEVYNKSA